MVDYIHRPSIGNEEECANGIKVTGDALFKIYRDGNISSYGNYIFYKKEDLSQFLLKTNYQQHTDNRFPFLISRVVEKTDSRLNLEELMAPLGFELLISAAVAKK